MKKLLALVLALVMSMSLVTISNAAFKDADKIDYKEAVDVMNAVGVFVGDEKGNFNAKDNLTREQAAKIIAYLELGEKAADALVGSATFTDVAATRWSAGFVSYCAQAGVVSGYDGKFDPAGQLTALQFGKMLLVEIGYDAKAAGMVGTDWAINTSKLMATTGLMNGIDGSVNQVLSREKAAQMCLNALKTPTVEYTTKGSNITVNGAEINFGASVPTYVTNTVAKQQTISKEQLTNSKEYTIELGEKLFKKLVLDNDTTDAFGRPTHTWKLATSKIGEYADEATLTYTTSVEYGDIYADLGLSKSTKVNEFYIDGKEAGLPTLVKKSETPLEGSGNGVLTQVYYDEDANDGKGEIIITEINTFVGKIGSVTKATSSADRYVSVTKSNVAYSALNTKYETEDFAKGDLVTYTAAYSKADARYDIQSVKALEKSTSGLLTEWKGSSVLTVGGDKGTSNSNFTVDGTTYKYSLKKTFATADGFGDWLTNGIADFTVNESKVDIYLDQYGYAIYVTGIEGVKNYAAVIGIGESNQYGSETKGVTLLLPDGTVKEVKAKLASSSANWSEFKGVAIGGTGAANYTYSFGAWGTSSFKNLYTNGAGNIVSYTEEDGVYKLTLVDTACYNTVATQTINANKTLFTNGKSKFVIDKDMDNTVDSGETFYATSETVFFVATNKTAGNPLKNVSYKVYVGYEAMPSLDGAKLYAITYKTNTSYATQLDYVYIYANELEGVSGVDTYFVKDKDAKIITDSTGKYYVLNAIIDGEETTIKIDAEAAVTGDSMKKADGTTTSKFEEAVGLFAIENVIKNSKGLVTSFKLVNSTAFGAANGLAGTVAANKVVFGIGTTKANATYWAYTDKTAAYVVDKDYKTITVSTLTSISDDANDLVFASHDNDAIEKKLVDVIVVEQPDTTKSNAASITKIQVAANVTSAGYDSIDEAIRNVITVPATTAIAMDVTGTFGTKNVICDYNMNLGDTKGASNWNTAAGTYEVVGGNYVVRATVTSEDGDNTVTKYVAVKAVEMATLTVKNTSAASAAKVTINGETKVIAKSGTATFADVVKAANTTFEVSYEAETGKSVSMSTSTGVTSAVDFNGVITVTGVTADAVEITLA